MTAKDMFEELGYFLVYNEEGDYIIYAKSVDDDRNDKVIDFGYQNKDVNVHYEYQHGEQVPSIGIEEFKAINRQLQELGWLM